MNRSLARAVMALGAARLFSESASACTPITTLMFAFGGPAPLMTAAGRAMGVLLIAVVLLKCYLYSRRVNYGKSKAAAQMFAANILAHPVLGIFSR